MLLSNPYALFSLLLLVAALLLFIVCACALTHLAEVLERVAGELAWRLALRDVVSAGTRIGLRLALRKYGLIDPPTWPAGVEEFHVAPQLIGYTEWGTAALGVVSIVAARSRR